MSLPCRALSWVRSDDREMPLRLAMAELDVVFLLSRQIRKSRRFAERVDQPRRRRHASRRRPCREFWSNLPPAWSWVMMTLGGGDALPPCGYRPGYRGRLFAHPSPSPSPFRITSMRVAPAGEAFSSIALSTTS